MCCRKLSKLETHYNETKYWITENVAVGISPSMSVLGNEQEGSFRQRH